MNTKLNGWLIGFTVISTLIGLISPIKSPKTPAQAAAQTGQLVILNTSQPGELSALQSSGGATLADYGGFQLVELPPGAPVPEGTRPVEDLIHLRGFDLDTRRPAIDTLPPQLVQSAAPGGRGFWMVQFAGPVQDEWLNGLHDQGLEIVAYMPENAYVVWGEQPAQRAADAAAANPLLTWQGAYQPAYRLDPSLRALAVEPQANPFAEVTVQIYRTKQTADTIARLTALADEILTPASTVLQYANLSLRLPSDRLIEVASLDDVFDVESYARPVLLDEAQGQIVAGNLTTSSGNVVPTGPGYLDWLAGKGFPTTPNSYPIVDIVDDGIDTGLADSILHPDFYELGDTDRADRIAYLLNCTFDPDADGLLGHGNINAGIVAGYNSRTGFPYEDGTGYNYGLGVSPYGRIAGTKIFDNTNIPDIFNCGYSEADFVYAEYIAGARITSNSWGYLSTNGTYTTVSQMYDAITRDAVDDVPGYQEMLHVFSAGNLPDSSSVLAPSTAKNVISVGATENVRSQGISDGCVTYADNADDIAGFSLPGPTTDLRAKPDIAAPGTHIQGPASQTPGYTGDNVCMKYYPDGQTLYTWSSGTSHAAPAVSGAAQLAYEYYGRVLDPGAAPSPAMLKALLLNSPRYLTGAFAGGTLPGVRQGWGGVDLGRLFDGVVRQVIDQTKVFTNTGESAAYQWQVVDSTKPVRATLVWTDAPGATTGAAYVNNLDLEVTAGGQIYRGNVFSGAVSVPGGSFDYRNNVENVFLPAGTTGTITVKVTAANLAGDGLPGQGDATDQDFALVVYNAVNPVLQAVELDAVSWDDALGNDNGVIDPGDRLFITVALHNKSAATVQGISAALSSATPGVVIGQPNSKYADIPAGGEGSNSTSFIVDVGQNVPCGNSVGFSLNLTTKLGSGALTLPGLVVGAVHEYSAVGLPVTIPDPNPGTGNPIDTYVTLTVPDSFSIADMNVRLNAQHTWVGDLSFTLISPSFSPITLIENRGLWGKDFQDTRLDDEAATLVANGTAPFHGSYIPEQPLSALDGMNAGGLWTLDVVDSYLGDIGSLTGFDLIVYACDASNVLVTPDHLLKAGHKGSTVNFVLTVTNTGSLPASFNVSVNGAIWTTTPAQNTINGLAPGGVFPLSVSVQIPADPPASSDQAIVTIVSQTDPLTRQSAVLTTGTGILFLPQVIR